MKKMFMFICIVAFVFSMAQGKFFGAERIRAEATASAGSDDHADIDRIAATREESFDITVSVTEKNTQRNKKSNTRGAFVTLDCFIVYKYTSEPISDGFFDFGVPDNRKISFSFRENQELPTGFTHKDALLHSLTVIDTGGYEMLYGAKAFDKIKNEIRTIKNGGKPGILICEAEAAFLDTLKYMDSNLKLSTEQQKTILEVIGNYRRAFDRFIAAYKNVKSDPDDADKTVELRQAYHEVTSIKLDCCWERSERIFSKEQIQSIVRNQMQAMSGSCTATFIENNDSFKYSFRNERGKWAATFEVNLTGKAFAANFSKFCSKVLGEDVCINLDAAFDERNVTGTIRAHSIEEALDQFAQLIEGKVMKRGGGWRIVAKD